AASGLQALAPQRALAVWGRLLSTGDTRVTVVDADWSRLKSLYEVRGQQPVLAWVDTTTPAQESTATGSILEALHQTAARDRFDCLVAHLQDLVVDVLYFEKGTPPDAKQGFFDMGMDSITAVELQSRLAVQLGQTLPPAVAFDYPNIEALANHLLQRLFPAP